MLETDITPELLRILISLTPAQTVSQAVQRFKGNISRQFSLAFPARLSTLRMSTLWAKGYFARSSGKVNKTTIRKYVEDQVSHHGYRGDWTRALAFKNPDFKSPSFKLAHCLTILNYQLVLVTPFRKPLFDDAIAPKLFEFVRPLERSAVSRLIGCR